MQILLAILLGVIGVLLFGFIIFFHELGHFLLAKFSKIRVNEFSVGMGPKLWQKQKGDTVYSLRLLPIGGYCAMEGEDDSSDDEAAFSNKPVWRRILVVIAGGVFNIVLGFVMMLILQSQQPYFITTRLAEFTDGSALQAAGAQVDDVILSVDGYRVYTDRDLSFALAMANPSGVDFQLDRDGEVITLSDVKMNAQTLENGQQAVTIDFYLYGEESTFFTTIGRAGANTLSMVRMVIETLKGMFTGRFGFSELAGPVGTAQAVVQVAGEGLKSSFWDGLTNIVTVMVLITVNLGVVNLLPLPALDGGRLLFLIWEGISRKPVPRKYEGYIHAVGFLLLIGLMVAVSFNDILRLFSIG